MALPAGYLDKSLVEDVRDGKSLLIGDLSKVGPPDDDIYIMMSVCVSVCHEKSSLPLQVCLGEIFFLNFFFEFFFSNFFLKFFFLKFFFF